MINVAQVQAFVSASPGDRIVVGKAQLVQLLAEIEIGQQARRALTTIKTQTAIAASLSGAPA